MGGAVHFPVVQHLRVHNYELYPDRNGSAGFDESLAQPLTLIVGANGLGKSTLLTLAFRLLTGPFDIPGAALGGELGSSRLLSAPLSSRARREFAHRVSDGAEDAFATITIRLGDVTIVITRSLANVALADWHQDGVVGNLSEDSLQQAIVHASGLSSFEDWILLLRYVTFYMDDRQVLFWDSSAQTTLLRSLFLSPADAALWVKRERNVLELDSEHRNMRTILNRFKRTTSVQIEPSSTAHNFLRDEYATLTQDEAQLTDQEMSLVAAISEIDDERAKLNITRLRAQRSLDENLAAYERLKMLDLASRFPTNAQSALFIWSQILSEAHCLVCDHDVPDLQAQVASRLTERRCAVCATDLSDRDESQPTPIVDAQVRQAHDDVEAARNALVNVEGRYAVVSGDLKSQRERLDSLQNQRADRQGRLTALRLQLPESDEEYLEKRTQLAALEATLDSLGTRLAESARDFDEFVNSTTAFIVQKADQVKIAFERYAHRFLVGAGELTWQPRSQQLGQSSYKVVVPAYKLQMLQGSEGESTVRSSVDDVSESQKEFIDLAFRMALIETAGNGAASILIDTPESSLDSVFSARAARVLAEYCASALDARLVIASNLTGSPLIPDLVIDSKAAGQDVHLINLLKLARATPATSQLGEDYDAAYADFLEQAGL